MTVQQIYQHYRIMPGLQLHQLRVAAVGRMVCENSIVDMDTQSVVLAGLFHDMGNIIKSDLTTFPEFLEPEGFAHWKMVKDEFMEQYGDNEHVASDRIAREIGLPESVRELIGHIGFSKLEWIRDHASKEQQAAEYADLRAAPHGVVPMLSRIEEAQVRYAGRRVDAPRSEEEFERLKAAALDIERQLFAESAIAPDDITEAAIEPLVAELRELRIA